MELFKQLSELTEKLDVTIRVLKHGEKLTVFFMPGNFEGLEPLKLTGTPDELDAGFIEAVKTPVQVASNLDTSEYVADLLKKVESARNKASEETLNKAKEESGKKRRGKKATEKEAASDSQEEAEAEEVETEETATEAENLTVHEPSIETPEVTPEEAPAADIHEEAAPKEAPPIVAAPPKPMPPKPGLF